MGNTCINIVHANFDRGLLKMTNFSTKNVTSSSFSEKMVYQLAVCSTCFECRLKYQINDN